MSKAEVHSIELEVQKSAIGTIPNPLGTRDKIMLDITAEFISTLYSKVKMVDMRCSNCAAVETMENPFECCARCQIDIYCSKKCQKKHWPQHKKYCKGAGGKIDPSKTTDRLNRFQRIFGPMLDIASHLTFASQNFKNKRQMTRATHIVYMTLADLPKRTPGPHPRLKIVNMQAMAMKELPKECLKRLREGLHQCPGDSSKILTYMLAYKPRGSSRPVLAGAMTLIPEGDPLLSALTSDDKRECAAQCFSFLRTINGIAKGEQPDLLAAIKET